MGMRLKSGRLSIFYDCSHNVYESVWAFVYVCMRHVRVDLYVCMSTDVLYVHEGVFACLNVCFHDIFVWRLTTEWR